MSKAEMFHMEHVAALGCVVCKRLGHGYSAAQLHHVASGSSLRSNFGVVPLCQEHHTGKSGLHGMGAKTFVRTYRVPWEKEEGLLIWLFEDLARYENR